MSDSIDDLAAELIKEHTKLEKAKSNFEKLKSNLLKEMQTDNIGAVKVSAGSVIVCTRTSKDYGDAIKIMEANLKAEKTRLDYLQQFVIKNVTHYLQVR